MGLRPFAVTCERQTSKKEVEIYNDIKYFRTRPNVFRKLKAIPFLRELIEIQNLKRRILDILAVHNIDIVHAHSPCIWGISALAAARMKNIPIIYEIRAFWEDAAVDAGKYDINSIKYRLVRRLETRLARKVDHIVTITHALKMDMVARGINERKISVVQNGVDWGKFKPRPRDQELLEKYELENCFIIGFVGSFFDFEGLDFLIDAVDKLREKGENIKLVLVGKGEKGSFLREMVKRLDLESEVIFTGRVPHEEIQKYYSVMDAMIYPRKSKRITELVTPLKPLEAMAMKKPVFLSDVDGHKELVPDERCAVFFKREKVDDLVDQLMAFIDNPLKLKEVGETGYAFIKKRKAWNIIVPSYLPIYRRVVA
jgi:PEP-CTERM/exosortase A-associated glycosyltransferase